MAQVVPEIDQGDVQEALDTFASPAVAAPVTLSFDGSQVKVFPADYTAALSLVPTDGELVPTLDPAVLTEVVDARVTSGSPVDASITLVDGRPQVVRAKPGVTFDPAELEAGFLDVVAQPQGERTLELTAQVAEPDFTTKDAKALRVTRAGLDFHDLLPLRRVPQRQHRAGGRADQRHAAQAGRDLLTQRHRRGAHRRQRIHQRLHHQRRDLDRGPRRRRLADGDHDVQRDVLRRAQGHRAQAALVLHRPLPDRAGGDRRLGLGRPAVQERHALRRPDPGRRHARDPDVLGRRHGRRMWSTKYWDITTSTGDRYNLTSPKTRRLDDDVPRQQGYGGFDIDVVRYFSSPATALRDARRRGVQHHLHAQRHGDLHQADAVDE